MIKAVQSVFLVPFFGKLPAYFDVWAHSCRTNHRQFHWYVYNDHIDKDCRVNDAVTLVPYRFEQMAGDFKRVLDIDIPGRHLRRVCDYRIMFYFLRKDVEPLDRYDFIGYTDVDMVYGRLADFLPEDPARYAMISADDGRPCGPFTLINRSQIHRLRDWDQIKVQLEQVEHKALDEDLRLVEVLSQALPAFCRSDSMQPQMSKRINSRHHYGIWDNGRLTVYDCWQRRCEGGFYHFSRYKNKPRFKVETPENLTGRIGIYKRGIANPDNIWTRLKMLAYLYM